MTAKKEDLRIRRTHKLLCDAMVSLLETRSFDEISVVDICEKAMVHRATFYKHFADKFDFMEYVVREKIREFYDKNAAEQMINEPKDAYSIIIENVVSFVEKNRQLLKISSHSPSNNFYDYIQKIVFEEMSNLLEGARLLGSSFSVPTDFLAQFLTGGFVSIVFWWLKNEDKYSRDEMITYIKNMLLSNERYSRLD